MTEADENALLESGRQFMAAGRYADARELYLGILKRRPDHPDALYSAAMAALQLSAYREAASLLSRCAAVSPGRADVFCSLSMTLIQLRRFDDSLAAAQKALAINPDFAEAHNNLGVAYMSLKKWPEAIAAFRRAITFRADMALTRYNIGVSLARAGQWSESLTQLMTARELDPRLPIDFFSLGSSILDARLYDDAIKAFRLALIAEPRHTGAWNNLGVALKHIGLVDQALDAFKQSRSCAPDNTVPHSNYVYTLYFHPDFDGPAIVREHQQFDAQHGRPLAHLIRPHTNTPDADRPLRIGYVSPHFIAHVVGQFMVPLLAQHDRRQFQSFCYADVARADAVTASLRSHAFAWRDIHDVSDDAAAGLIRQDRIDILVDLMLHLGDNRPLIFARKPAPIQLSYLAYCGTSGLSAVDYRFTDAYLDPPGQGDADYSEQSLRLRSYWCYKTLGSFPAVVDPPCIKTGRITFGCLNNFAKVSEPCLSAWAELLRRVPNSRLMLLAPQGSARYRVGEFWTAHGLDPERLCFVDMVPLADYFARYQEIDIVLDPFPYGGGTTSCDALWMGVPVVTLSGRTAVGRGGVTLLSQIKATELIGASMEQYLQIASNLAADVSRLKTLRHTLRARMRASPLMDAPAFALDVEQHYRAIWRRWCATTVSRA
jgi:predicted O-linked N-acetylglucosamine transferase (SPINDLY family)